MLIRQIDPRDGPVVRDLAIRMYTDSPEAYGETLDEAIKRLPEQWARRAEWLAEGKQAVGFVAYEDDKSCGFVMGLEGRFIDGAMDWQYPRTVTMARAWVAPAFRNRGIGRDLATAVRQWALQKGAKHLEAQVTENNERAKRFYAGLGFTDTGRREPLLSNPSLDIWFLASPIESLL